MEQNHKPAKNQFDNNGTYIKFVLDPEVFTGYASKKR